VLTLHVTAISDIGYPIIVPDADVNHIDYYKNVGFDLERIEKLMVCPTNEFIAACTVGFVNDLPYILDFVVHPEYQKKGLASKMMQRTLSLQHKRYPAIRLSITEGNNAEEFYEKIGFISLAKKGYMSKII